MANGQAVDAERQTMAGALVEPRTPLDDLGPLRVSSKFSSPLWQASNRENGPSDAETPIDAISGATTVLSPAAHERMEGAGDEAGSVDAGPDGAANDWFDEAAPAPGHDDHEVDVDHGVGSGVDFDAPTETFHAAEMFHRADTFHAPTETFDAAETFHSAEAFDAAPVTDASEVEPSGTADTTADTTADPKARPFPWPPSPWPRNATAPTVRIRLADLLSLPDEDPDLTSDEAIDQNDRPAGPAASPAPIKLSPSVNARTLVLAAVASLVVLCGGALFGGPMGAVTIAPETGPTSAAPGVSAASAASGGLRVSGASVVPAVLLARSPAASFPASIEKLDAPRATPSATPSGHAAMAGIPGMMGTPVPVSTPARGGTSSNVPATALSTESRSSDSDEPLGPVAPRRDLAPRGDSRAAYSGGVDRHVDEQQLDDQQFGDVTRAPGSGSGLVGGLVGGVLN